MHLDEGDDLCFVSFDLIPLCFPPQILFVADLEVMDTVDNAVEDLLWHNKHGAIVLKLSETITLQRRLLAPVVEGVEEFLVFGSHGGTRNARTSWESADFAFWDFKGAKGFGAVNVAAQC